METMWGLVRSEAAALNAPFLHFHLRRRPGVLLKWAMTLDGKIATVSGKSQWITGPRARAEAHSLRRRVDAVLVGTGTALADAPLLTPRPSRGRSPYRVVLDRQGRLPLHLRLLREEPGHKGPRRNLTSRRAPERRLRLLARRGVQSLVIPERAGALRLSALLEALGSMGISQVLVEGGGALAGSFVEQGLVDEVAAFVAPCVLGGRFARSPVGGGGVARLSEALRLERLERLELGEDFLVRGIVRRARP